MARIKPEHLPGELLLVIFDDGRPSSRGTRAWSRFYLDLSHFALVHRTWTTWAQDLLFTHVWPNCGSSPTSRSTASSLDLLLCAPRHLRLKTRSMSLHLGRSLFQGRSQVASHVLAQHASWDQFANILRSFPGVHSLQLDLHSLDGLQATMDLEQLAVVLQYHALRCLELWSCVTPPEEALSQLIVSWPQLTRLELGSPRARLFHSSLAPVPSCSCSLTHLRELVLKVEVGKDAREWLRATFAGAPQLRVLRCSVADVPVFVELLHSSLHDLTVDSAADSIFQHGALTPLAITSVARCGALHTLLVTDNTVACFALQSFPANLRHVSLVVDPQLLLGSNLNWSTLKTITVVWPQAMRYPNVDVEGGAVQKGHETIQERCSKYGIEFTQLAKGPLLWARF